MATSIRHTPVSLSANTLSSWQHFGFQAQLWFATLTCENILYRWSTIIFKNVKKAKNTYLHSSATFWNSSVLVLKREVGVSLAPPALTGKYYVNKSAAATHVSMTRIQ